MKLILSLMVFSFSTFSQDYTFEKSIYLGGYFVVPKNETWEIIKIFVSDGGGHNIQLSNNNFKQFYKAKDTIKTPFYIPEMEFLNKKGTTQFIFKIKKSQL